MPGPVKAAKAVDEAGMKHRGRVHALPSHRSRPGLLFPVHNPLSTTGRKQQYGDS
jgi:hypothetical protein